MKVRLRLLGAGAALAALLVAGASFDANAASGEPQAASGTKTVASASNAAAEAREPSTGTSLATFDKLRDVWEKLHDYSATIESHEVLGDRVSDHELHYSFRKPHEARLDVITGTKSGSTMTWDGGDSVTAYRRALSFFKIHKNPWDAEVTSLRGNGVISPVMGDLIACYNTYRGRLKVQAGPTIDGQATEQISLPYANVSCPDDSAADKAVTLDIVDLSKSTGLILRRERYIGDQLVERFDLKDYKIDAVSDADLR